MVEDFTGERLRELRKRARLSQMQVVAAVKISEAALCYIENGRRKPHPSTLEKLLSFYMQRIRYLQQIRQSLDGEERGREINSQETQRNRSNGVYSFPNQNKAFKPRTFS